MWTHKDETNTRESLNILLVMIIIIISLIYDTTLKENVWYSEL